MAQYKVIQDIEAEDHLLGPLSLRQFIYAGGAAVMGYLSFISVAKGAAFLLVVFVPPMLFCMFFAWPWSPDQPTEVWALARIRFMFKPRRRIWDQSGAKNLVTITVPKKVEKIMTNGLTQTEVRSRLSALADTIDSRGWAIKNANVTMATLPSLDATESDRLVTSGAMPQAVADYDVQASDDILDEHSNPVAQQLDQMIQASAQAHRQELVDRLKAPDTAPPPPRPPAANAATPQQPAPDYWFLHQPPTGQNGQPVSGNVVFANPQVVQPGTTQAVGPVAATPSSTEQALAEELRQHNTASNHIQNMHLKTINPIDPNNPVSAQPDPAAAAATDNATPQSDAAILNLASNNDLNVATLARQAKQARNPEPPEDEVVISLH